MCVCVHTLVSLLDHVSRVMTVKSPGGFSGGRPGLHHSYCGQVTHSL